MLNRLDLMDSILQTWCAAAKGPLRVIRAITSTTRDSHRLSK